MLVYGIDPGPRESALVIWDYRDSKVEESYHLPNKEMVDLLRQMAFKTSPLAIEMIESMGMAVGAAVFQTCVWIGRFTEAYDPDQTYPVGRHAVKLTICGSRKAKDANIRQALIDRFGAPGTKSNPGKSLYGIANHKWSALAVAVTFADLRREGKI